jgi:hypothetical protein
MSTAKWNWAAGFFSIGLMATLVCLALILAGNTEAWSRFEHRGFPLSWAFAGAAAVAFMLAEYFDEARKQAGETLDRRPQYSADWVSREVEFEGEAS